MRLINADKLHTDEYSGWYDEAIIDEIENAETVDAIPVAWLEERMEKSSGFRHAVLSETIDEWRGVRDV